MKTNSNNETFKTIYEALNQQQKQAVDCIDGPVMVVAGPGTGKTQILAARIANILLQSDALPENILCLTFTDAGVVAMRKRLSEFIGPDAYRLQIHTFHSFCHTVIQSNKEAFEHIDWQAVSDIEKHELLRKLLDELKPGHPLKKYKGNVYQDVMPLIKLFSLMKREQITANDINHKCVQRKQDALEDPEFRYKRKSGENNAGDLKQKDIDTLYQRLDQLMAAANMLQAFTEAMNQKERYDFDDMIGWVIELFEKRPDVLTRYQEKYLYILVDEFQDTNASQYQVIRKLSAFWEDNPNLFVVGDDDQSIYRFQGAEIGNITSFYQTYQKHLTTVVLEHNYRSGQDILNSASQVIGQNTERLVHQMNGIQKKLVASNQEVQSKAQSPKINVFKNPFAESVYLGSQIRQLIEQNVTPHEIAIIYRKHSQADELIRYFTDIKIPIHLIRRENALQNPAVAKFIQFLQYLNYEIQQPFSGGNLLFKILHFKEFGLQPAHLALLQRKASESRMSIREYVYNGLPDPFQQAEVMAKFRQFNDVLDEWIRQFQEKTPVEATSEILINAGFLKQLLSTATKERDLEAMRSFFDFMKAESERNKKMSLADFLDTLNVMETYNLDLPMQVYYGQDNGVNLMTAHGAKGLEFEHVFVIGCTESHWEKNRIHDRFSLEQIFPHLKDEFALEESRRLFYVAITRAKLNLNVSYYQFEKNGKDVSPSRFVVEMQDSEKLVPAEISMDDQSVTNFMLSYSPPAKTGPITLPDAAFVNLFLKDYALSVTHLNAYLKCPISFYFNQVLRVPAAKNAAMSFGSAIHGVLEKIFTDFINKNKTPAPGDILGLFDKQMFAYQSGFTTTDLNQLTQYGHSFMPSYVQNHIEHWQSYTAFEIEKSIHTHLNDIPINGKLDRVSLRGQQVWVTDYKTGNADNRGRKLDPPRENYAGSEVELLFGGDYWRQIMFYKILIDADPTLSWSMVAGEIDFVEPDKSGNFQSFNIPVTEFGVKEVKDQIKMVYSKIMNKEFAEGCGDEQCQWCQFVRTFEIS